MSARTKLNLAAVNGAILIAALAGIAANSWLIFWLLFFVLLAGDLASGLIRPPRKNHGQYRR